MQPGGCIPIFSATLSRIRQPFPVMSPFFPERCSRKEGPLRWGGERLEVFVSFDGITVGQIAGDTALLRKMEGDGS